MNDVMVKMTVIVVGKRVSEGNVILYAQQQKYTLPGTGVLSCCILWLSLCGSYYACTTCPYFNIQIGNRSLGFNALLEPNTGYRFFFFFLCGYP